MDPLPVAAGDDDIQGIRIKRIIGLSRETVEILNGRVHIDGHPLSEPYVTSVSYLQPQSDRTWTLAPGTCFVLGDARDDSLDSRRLGPISADQIIGAAVCRLWPPPFAL
jgi:signal peptidase I